MTIALVTGTSSGIGLATAVTLARGGHIVIATMRNLESAGELEKIVAAEKLPVSLAVLDVDDDASVESALGKVLAEHGRLDVLVNNAGIGGGGSVEESSAARFREVMETNFFGALRCIKAVVPGMRERRHGCIVNVTSISGRLAMAPAAAYCASKFALEALSECLAQEMKAFNVRVAIIEPGVIATPIFSDTRQYSLPTCPAPKGFVCPVADQPNIALHCRRENPRDCRRRQLAAPLSRRSGRGTVSQMAGEQDRRRSGQPWRSERRGIQTPSQARVRPRRKPLSTV
jgi:NAD(P)-dependent dehydrogenase (short-subunit alcohol dehydrogenase family)